jgi:hypothetical protein
LDCSIPYQLPLRESFFKQNYHIKHYSDEKCFIIESHYYLRVADLFFWFRAPTLQDALALRYILRLRRKKESKLSDMPIKNFLKVIGYDDTLLLTNEEFCKYMFYPGCGPGKEVCDYERRNIRFCLNHSSEETSCEEDYGLL